ncbi:MAG: L-tyrosine/L-tryptophan isonitrile synthase family protein [Legionella sp.]|nr:L-tyrosine/L-tryptophan isonitrile synthase family protein [Legionella sp.]
MENLILNENPSKNYKIGLNREMEAVISAHFMHSINQDINLSLYDFEEFSSKVFYISSKSIAVHLIPILLESSNNFIKERVIAAKIRARENFRSYGLDSPNCVRVEHFISEVMFDRQFLKGSKSNFSKLKLCETITTLIHQELPIAMVIPALPYKSSSPIKTRGVLPDLAEVNFLLSLYEIIKTIDTLYREYKPINYIGSIFKVICDGSRFNKFLNEPDEIIHLYQKKIYFWIDKLGLSDFIQLADYQEVISNYLPKNMQDDKIRIRNTVRELYKEIMLPLLNPNDMAYTLKQAIALDPDPEKSNTDARFVPLFKSLVYIVRYKLLLQYANLHDQNYTSLYKNLTQNIFTAYAELTESDFDSIHEFIINPSTINPPAKEKVIEYLRHSMIREAWMAAIEYLAEIRSDRDLSLEPISTCLPNHVRWTIHAKPGQLAILTTTASGDPVQPWHGVAVFKLSKSNKIKLYTLPILALEGNGAIPVVEIKESLEDSDYFVTPYQPLFYVDRRISFKNEEDLFAIIKNDLTRKRKF